jgi:hypothetical protein
MNKKATAKKGAESKCAWLDASTVANAGSTPQTMCAPKPPASYGEKAKPPVTAWLAAFAVGRARHTPAKTG